jgi:hypothetical protein
MTIKDLKKELLAARQAQAGEVSNFYDSDNPQTKELGIRAWHYRELLDSIIDRIEGDRTALSFYK